MEYLNSPTYVFWACVLCHFLADYNLQGILCNLKCQDWWEDQIKIMKDKYGDKIDYDKYKNDWFEGLSAHALMWSIITFLPMLPTLNELKWSFIVLVNYAIHLKVDDLKANRHKINLCQDQHLHFAQIIITLIIWYWLRHAI